MILDDAIFTAARNQSSTGEGGEWSDNQKRCLKHYCERDQLAFTRYFFKKREGNQFMVSPHHRVLANTLDRVVAGEIKRLIINIPPGYTKTEMAVIAFIARGLAVNPASKFIHISYADNLALLNSGAVKEVVTGEEFQELWPMEVKKDAKSKKAWYTRHGGGMMAVASGGTITGFRAGRMMEGFSGAMVIDDPIKPDDAFSDTIRERVNMRFTNTFKSRLAHEGIPIIVIMQRIHENDPTGFLLKGGSGECWHHLKLPAHTRLLSQRRPYPEEFTHGIEIPAELPPGPLWEYKHTMDDIELMEKTDPYTYSSQYDQEPTPLGGGMFKGDWWRFYKEPPTGLEYAFVTADTAQKTEEHHDNSVFQLWGKFRGRIYLLDTLVGKWEADQLLKQARKFWKTAQSTFASRRQFGFKLRYMAVEDKASGTGLIQTLRNVDGIPIMAIQRSKDKVTRAHDAVPHIAGGCVVLPEDAPWVGKFKIEVGRFSATMAHEFDDQVDAMMDAIDLELGGKVKTAGAWG